MKKVLFLSMVAFLGLFTACKKETFKAPELISPASQTVEAGTSIELSFDYMAEAGFKSSSVVFSNGTGNITTDGVVGSTSGTIVVSFTAGTSAGAGSADLTITDNENQSTKSTAVIGIVEEQIEFTVSGNITQNTTWETGKVYILTSRIAVVDGVTLTIEPGVIVKGEAGTGANATALIIARGGKLMAEGTSEAPIIFTSVADEIMPGQIASPNLDPDLDGLWGGLIILGKAPISADAAAVQIEGIPPSDQNGLYGGNVPGDNSGVIKFISIRHGGANIGEGNEINGLTLGGVGSGTIIEYVEVVANQDDGIEWFGGTVNVSNALVWNSGDDAFDTDQAWAGTLDNFVGICGAATDHVLEIDGPEGSYLDAHTVKNGTIKGHSASELGDFRDGARGTFENIYFVNFPDPAFSGRGDLSISGDASQSNFANGFLNFNNLEITPSEGVALTAIFRNGTDSHATVVPLGENTVGADISKFQAWTWAAASGNLSGF